MTNIEWADETWNPVTGCTKVSPGCDNCYAERMAKRQKAMGTPQYRDVVDENGWTGKVMLAPQHILEQPRKWKKPRKIFICSMSDFFNENVPFEWKHPLFDTIEECPRHTFQICTKRPGGAYDYIDKYGYKLPNLHLYVTAESQEQYDKRVPILMQIPAAVRGVSLEPMLGPIDLRGYALDHVICGGESGPGARPMSHMWAAQILLQCKRQDIPFFFKQWGAWAPVRWLSSGKYIMESAKGQGEELVNPKSKTHPGHVSDDGFVLIGKKKAGRLLNGRTWDEMPGNK